MENLSTQLSGDELPRFATEDERPHIGDETSLTDPIVVEPKRATPPAMPLPRNVRGRRY